MGAGIQTASMYSGGGPGTKGNTELYDGTSWTEVADLSTARKAGGGAGTQSQAVVYGGTPPVSGATEEFTISLSATTAAAWSSGGNLNVARGSRGPNAGAGILTAGLAFGGNPGSGPSPQSAETEEYDGTSWTNANDAPVARGGGAAFGTQTAALGAAGYGNIPPLTNYYPQATILYDGTNWTSGENFPKTATDLGSCGTTTAGLSFAGYTPLTTPSPQKTNQTEEYDGTDYASGGNMNTARRAPVAFGTQTAAFGGGGFDDAVNPHPALANAEEYDGSSWTNVTSMPVSRQNAGGYGLQTAAMIFGGYSGSNQTTAFTYDGTSYSAAPSIATARNAFFCSKATTTSTGGFGAGGNPAPTGANTEEFSGDTTAIRGAKTVDFD